MTVTATPGSFPGSACGRSKKPKTIDYDVIDGPTKGKKQLGIYELEGDTVKFCFAKPDSERPTDFKPGEGRTSSVWKREKK